MKIDLSKMECPVVRLWAIGKMDTKSPPLDLDSRGPIGIGY